MSAKVADASTQTHGEPPHKLTARFEDAPEDIDMDLKEALEVILPSKQDDTAEKANSLNPTLTATGKHSDSDTNKPEVGKEGVKTPSRAGQVDREGTVEKRCSPLADPARRQTTISKDPAKKKEAVKAPEDDRKGPIRLITDAQLVVKRYEKEVKEKEIDAVLQEHRRALLAVERISRNAIVVHAIITLAMLAVIAYRS